MKDPLGIMGTETVSVMAGYSGGVLEEFVNMNMFNAGIARKKYKLPYYFDGTGGVVYGPYLYYNRYKRCIHQLNLCMYCCLLYSIEHILSRNAGVSAEYKLKENEVLKITSSPSGRI